MSSKAKPDKRSPLKRKPLRNAGDSVQRELDELLDAEFVWIAVLPVWMLVFAGYEWARSIWKIPAQPVLMSVLALAAIGYAVYRFARLRRRTAALKLGRDGEKVVAQFLEAHRKPEWRLFNDIPAGHFNVDHVLIVPQGVFVLETKTFSKPEGRDAKVVYDGAKVLVDGHSPDRDPVEQARAIRDWVRDTLAETTGRRIAPRGVVVMPGWWIDQPKSGPRPEIWVLNEKALLAFIEHEPVVLKVEDIALFADALAYRITRE